MALTDINFQEGEGQDFIVERTPGVQQVPVDILVESAGSQCLIMEISSSGRVFVLLD